MSIQECNLVILQAILLVSHKHRNKLPSTQVQNGLQWGNNKKANQADLGTFTHILEYSGMFRNYSGILRMLCNSSIFRTLVYSKSETKVYSAPCQICTVESFAKLLTAIIVFAN